MKKKSNVKAAVHKHERAMHPGKPLTRLRAGGKANAAMKSNMNQRSPVRKSGLR